MQQPSNKKKVVEKTSDVANPSEVEKTYAELSDKKVPEKMATEKKAPEKSKLPAAPSSNEPPGGSEEESESSDEEVSSYFYLCCFFTFFQFPNAFYHVTVFIMCFETCFIIISFQGWRRGR